MIKNILVYFVTCTPLLVLCDHYIDSPILMFIVLCLSSLIMIFLPYFIIGLYIIIPALWIWGFVIAVGNLGHFWIFLYCICMVVNLVYYGLFFNKNKFQSENNTPSDSLEQIKQYSSLNIRNEENETTLKKFKKVNNDIIEVDIRNFTDDELMKLRSVLPPKCIHQSDTNNFVAYIFLSECLLSEQIRILSVVQKIENDEYSRTPENTTTDTNTMGRVDISNFSLSDIKSLLEKIPEDRVLNNPLEDDVIEIDLEGLPLSERAKIGAAISEIKSKHA